MKNKFSWLFNLAVVIAPILSAYSVYGIFDLGSLVILLTSSPLLVMGYIWPQKFPKSYLPFFICSVVFAVIVNIYLPQRVILYSVLLFLSCMYFNFDVAYRIYDKVVTICIVFFIIQEICFLLLGYRISGIFAFMPTIYGDISGELVQGYKLAERSASFFLEPSYFAQYLCPYVVILLFSERPNLKKAVFVTITMLLIRSGNGLLCVGLIWLIWLILSNVQTKYKILGVSVVSICFLVVYLLIPNLITDLVYRISELSASGKNERYMSSGFIRIYRGYYLYGDLSAWEKFFGSSPENIGNMIKNHAMFPLGDTFLNGIQQLLLYHGVIGLSLYLLHLYYLSKKSRLSSVLIICVCLLLFTESYFLTLRCLLATVLTYSYKSYN